MAFIAMDMLIKLYGTVFDQRGALPRREVAGGIEFRKPIGPEHMVLADWVEREFSSGWASEVRAALANRPVTVWLALRGGRLAGFACYDATARGYLGPIGVEPQVRSQGIGAELLWACLRDMRIAGYGYAIVGAAGAPNFFTKAAGATEIPDSTPGLYAGMLKR